MTAAMLAIAMTLTSPAPCGTLLLPVDGKTAAALCRDRKLRVFSLSDGKIVRTINGSGSARLALSTISDDGRWVMLGDYAGDVTIMDTTTGESKVAQHIDHYLTAAAFSHDGRLLALAPGGAAVRILDTASGGVVRELERSTFTGALAFSRDNRKIAAAGVDDVRIYDADGKRVAQNGDFLLSPLALAFSADGKQVVAGGADKSVVFIDTATGKTLRRTSVSDAVNWIDFAPDGKQVAISTMHADNVDVPSAVFFTDAAAPQKKTEWMPPNGIIGGGWTADGHFIAAIATEGVVHLQPVH